MKLLLTLLLFISPLLLHAGEVQRFCSMEEGVDQLLIAADIPEEMRGTQRVRFIAKDIIEDKMAENPGKSIAIGWTDIYDMRGTVNAMLCNDGHRMNCVGQAIDAVGSGLTGSTLGRAVMGVGLALAGPPGFVLLSGMAVTQETFQCNPSGIIMAVEAGTSVTLMLPFCKVPGVSSVCVSVGQGLNAGVTRSLQYFFRGRVRAVAVQATQKGVRIVLRKAKGEAVESAKIGTTNKLTTQDNSPFNINIDPEAITFN